PMAAGGRHAARCLGRDPAARVLDHQRNRRCDLAGKASARNPAGGWDRPDKGPGRLSQQEVEGGDMQPPQLLNDVINVLLLLAPAAAVVCLVLAGITLRYEGGGITLVLGGGFTKWMFWCVVFLTLQPLLSWFSSFGVGVPLPGGGINSQ